MANLKAAEDAKTAFLEANAIEADVDAAATQVRLEAAVGTAEDALVTASTEDANSTDDVLFELGVSYSKNDTPGVKAAKLADAETAAQKKITDATKAVAEAQTALNAKSALAAAAKTLDERTKAVETANKAATDALSTQEGDVAALRVLLGDNSLAVNISDNTVPNVIGVNATTKKLEVLKTFAEATTTSAEELALANKLLASINARIDADKNLAAIELSETQAKFGAYIQDFASSDGESAFYDLAKVFLGSKVTSTETNYATLTDANKASVTNSAIVAELTKQKGIVTSGLDSKDSITFAADGSISNTNVTGTDALAALGAYNALWAKVAAFVTAVDGTNGVSDSKTNLLSTLATKQADLKAAEALDKALDKLVADLKEAQATTEELKAKDKAIADAKATFEDLGIEVPVTLDSVHVGTTENDVYVAAGASATLVNFGLEGKDLLFIGKDFTLNTGALKDGNDAVLEVFFIQDGNNAKVVLETKTYGSNESKVDEVEITLTGVKAADLTLTEDGFVTLA